MPQSETIQLQVTPEVRRELEAAAAAARLNLSLSAYLLYAHRRAATGQDAPRLDRHVWEVFGRHGELMRRLAK